MTMDGVSLWVLEIIILHNHFIRHLFFLVILLGDMVLKEIFKVISLILIRLKGPWLVDQEEMVKYLMKEDIKI
jgi:hypothetical protein